MKLLVEDLQPSVYFSTPPCLKSIGSLGLVTFASSPAVELSSWKSLLMNVKVKDVTFMTEQKPSLRWYFGVMVLELELESNLK